MDGWVGRSVGRLVVGFVEGTRKDYTKTNEQISTKRCRLTSVKHKLYT